MRTHPVNFVVGVFLALILFHARLAAQAVVSFAVINADTNQPIAGFSPLPENAVLNLATLPSRRLNIQAVTTPATVGSVRFTLDGSVFRIENAAPYALAGDNGGDYNAWTPATTAYSLTGTPYSGANGSGMAGTSLTRHFSVTDSQSTAPVQGPTGSTAVSISGRYFLINGTVTDRGTVLEGTLPNSRMVNATFDDANPATVGYWAYPGSIWDPLRNTKEFVQALPTYRARGLLAVTLNFQGGGPKAGQFGSDQPWNSSAFDAAGNLKTAYFNRMDQAIRALDANGMVAIVGYFYHGQVDRLSSAGATATYDPAVVNAVDRATDWLLSKNYGNVMVEIANECDNGYLSHPMLRPSAISTLIARVRTRSSGRLLVSTSFSSGYNAPDSVLAASNFVLLHGNGLTPSSLTSYIRAIRSRTGKPIIVNEDSVGVDNFKAAAAEHVSWGYYEQGSNDYFHGFQSPPVNWGINTTSKMTFFSQLSVYAGGGTPRITALTLINADTNLPQVIPGTNSAVLTDNVTIDLGALPTRNLNVRADASSAASVRFGYDASSTYRIESTPPFALAGDTAGDYAAWTPALGPHVLTATPYFETGGTGTQGATVTVHFTVAP